MKRLIKGFTLLEVLVALAVAGVGLAGVIKVAGSNAYNAQHLKNKTIAQWVAMNRITELKVQKAFPAIGKTKGDMEMAGRKWYWRQETRATPFTQPELKNNLRQVEVMVYADEDSKSTLLASVTTVLNLEQ